MNPTTSPAPHAEFDQIIIVRHPDRTDVTVTKGRDAYYISGPHAENISRAVRNAVFGNPASAAHAGADARCLIP